MKAEGGIALPGRLECIMVRTYLEVSRMNSIVSLIAFTVSTIAVVAPVQAEGFADHGSITAKRSGDTVTITLAGKGDWHVNSEYGIKVELGAVKLGKTDAKYAGMHDGKADSVSFEAKDAAQSGTMKAVFCDKTSCTAPLKTTFDVK